MTFKIFIFAINYNKHDAPVPVGYISTIFTTSIASVEKNETNSEGGCNTASGYVLIMFVDLPLIIINEDIEIVCRVKFGV